MNTKSNFCLKNTKIRHQLLLLLLALLACFCECKCGEKPTKPIVDTNGVFVPTDLSMVWIRPYHSDTSYDGSGFPLLTGDYVVFANNSGVYPQMVVLAFITKKQEKSTQHGKAR